MFILFVKFFLLICFRVLCYVCLSACLLACLSICLSACLPVCLSVYLPASLPVCLSACLSVCLTLFLCFFRSFFTFYLFLTACIFFCFLSFRSPCCRSLSTSIASSRSRLIFPKLPVSLSLVARGTRRLYYVFLATPAINASQTDCNVYSAAPGPRRGVRRQTRVFIERRTLNVRRET